MNWMQILHVGVNYDVQDHLDETVEEEISVNINQCHICCLKLASRNKVMDHVEKIHVEYFQGVMEIFARNRREIYCLIGPWLAGLAFVLMIYFALL